LATRRRNRSELARLEISTAPTPAGKPTPFWIETDGYDRDAFRQWASTSPSFRDLAASGGRLLPEFDSFLLDLYALLFKLNIVFRPPQEVLPSAAPHGPLLKAIAAAPALEWLRLHTALDEARAAIATLLLAEKLLAVLKSEWLLNRGQMLDAWALRHQEQEAARLAEQAAAAEELAAHSPRPSVQHLARRLRKLAELAERALQQRREDFDRTVRESVERQAQRLERELAQSATALEDFEAALQDWSAALGREAFQSPALQVELGKRLAQNPRLRKLAALVGRMRAQMQALRQRALERANEETYAVAAGSDLGRLLPCELAALRHPLRRLDFARRLVEGQLLQYELRGYEQSGRGPLVVCLDVSSSMSGDKEIWAKAVALTLLDLAQRQRRSLHAICFAGPEQPLAQWDLNGPPRYASEPQQVLEFAGYFPGGATDFRPPLTAARRRLEEKPLRKGDIVFITDGECPLDEAWLAEFAAAKAKLGFRLYSVLIDVGGANLNTLLALSDRVTSVRQLTSEASSALFLALNEGSRRR